MQAQNQAQRIAAFEEILRASKAEANASVETLLEPAGAGREHRRLSRRLARLADAGLTSNSNPLRKLLSFLLLGIRPVGEVWVEMVVQRLESKWTTVSS